MSNSPFVTDRKRVGILTSGGDCPGLNAVIRGVVKAATQLDYECLGILRGFEGLLPPARYIPLTKQNTIGILHQGGTILGSTNKGHFGVVTGASGHRPLDAGLIETVRATFHELGLCGLICVGGDGSLTVAQQFHEQGLPVVGVPKTIDNDLGATAYAFGFDSAISIATDALDRLHTTAASHERIMVLEVMGRHAGWIALYSGIAGGGDVILIPEIPWTFERIREKVQERRESGRGFTLIVVAEGAQLPSGELICKEQATTGQARLGGIGEVVAAEVQSRTGQETRCVVLGHLQRGGPPTTFDRVLATQFGAHAMRLVYQRRFGEMISFVPPEVAGVPIAEAVCRLSTVDPHGSAVQAARALGISFGDRPVTESPFELKAPDA